MSKTAKRSRVPEFVEKKRRGEKIAVLTAYDATMARLMDRAGVDALLVGDSLGVVVAGSETTLEVTMEMMVHHTRSVANGTKHALVIADMPFLSYQPSVADAIRNGGRLLAEGHAAAVKLEGGRPMAETVARMVEVGIPVMGHLGLTPQSVNALGGYRRLSAKETDSLVEDAKLLEQAGAFSIVLEMVPAEVAKEITAAVAVPTIGIGAGPHCDGQVLVSYDAFGLFDEFVPSFVKRYAELGQQVTDATKAYVAEVKDGRFPK
ncbi:MAG: hypothetical protein RL328_1846 [Acidobacteriota bacterium]|jgi:3-methyl-2-oxobutanoate hydroxymethyltransferase